MRDFRGQHQLVVRRGNKETPLPLYLCVLMHVKTENKKKRIRTEKLYALGLSVSYGRVLRLSSDLAKLCVNVMRKIERFALLTYVDMDHNPSSTTTTGSFSHSTPKYH